MNTRYGDERIDRLNGQISFLFLMLTQVAVGSIILYKRYVLWLPSGEYSTLQWLLGLSAGGYWAARLYFSGSLPVIPFKRMILLYFGLVALIAIPTLLIHGLPQPSQWYEVLYPFLGVAVVLSFYSLVAYLGKRRLEDMISE
jgi:hypothetical protein